MQKPCGEIFRASLLLIGPLDRCKTIVHRLDPAFDPALYSGDVAGDAGAERLDLLRQIVDAVLALVRVAVEALDLADQLSARLAELVELTGQSRTPDAIMGQRRTGAWLCR